MRGSLATPCQVKKTMDEKEIDTALRRHELTAPIFGGVYSWDRLPHPAKFPTAYVVNLSKHNEFGTHWVVVFFEGELHGEYFDTFGRPVPEKLRGQLPRGFHVTRATIQVQSPTATTCGQHCMTYILFKAHGLSLKEITRLFKDKTQELNDKIAVELVREEFGKSTKVRDTRFLREWVKSYTMGA